MSGLLCHRTHLVAGQPIHYHLRRAAADLLPEEILLFTAALGLQHCPEGLSQLEDLQAWVAFGQDLQL